ncbi:glycosyltransferase [Mesobacterium pallidum]|uniref:glycosyltransferase n=1 Tax=Mesobacterium pallidum TaxID=2872037 RepID=UPI001EE31D5E|nr:glycosyltransferase [Mesobacterium pallidum]
MKILFYNWVDYLDDEKRGGGVSVYQRNIIQALDKQPGVDCTFLSSGISYDLLDSKPRWDRIKHGPNENRQNRYEIVNSGCLSPSHHSFGSEGQLDDPATVEVFHQFIAEKGPFDVIHFNNLEGIPAKALRIKEKWPDTRVVFSLHNYYPMCPQVNLWYQERENCTDFDDGRKCEHCLPHQHDTRIVQLANSVAYNLKKVGVRPGSRLFDRGFGPAMRVAGKTARVYNTRIRKGRPASATSTSTTGASKLLKRVEASNLKFTRRRREMVQLINTHCDQVLCVSARVGQVAKRYGIAPALIRTSYIGTRHAEKFAQTTPAKSIVRPDGTVTIAYLGYMRRDKGFFFLLDALEALPQDIAARVNVMICSRLVDQHTMDRITNLSTRVASMLFADGYKHDELDELLSEVDLGVIPVLWEDNLPQVAIEMHARHIPLLTSDLGGAQELGNCRDLVFRAGDEKDFADRLKLVLDGKISTKKYWEGAMTPYSMEDHIAELLEVYNAPARAIETLEAPAPDKRGTPDQVTPLRDRVTSRRVKAKTDGKNRPVKPRPKPAGGRGPRKPAPRARRV